MHAEIIITVHNVWDQHDCFWAWPAMVHYSGMGMGRAFIPSSWKFSHIAMVMDTYQYVFITDISVFTDCIGLKQTFMAGRALTK